MADPGSPQAQACSAPTATGDDGFWTAQSIVTPSRQRLSAGIYRARLITPRPVFATVHIDFDGDDIPPLRIALDPIGGETCTKVFRIAGECRRVDLMLSPPIARDDEIAFDITALSFGALGALGLSRIVKTLRRPLASIGKIRQLVSGVASFSLTPSDRAYDAATIYGAWRRAFEGRAEQDRLAAELIAYRGGRERGRGLLVVHITSRAHPDALRDALRSIDLSEGDVRVHLLVIEEPALPLGHDLAGEVEARGGTIMASDAPPQSGRSVLEVIEEHATAVGAAAFLFVSRRGRFHKAAFACIELELLARPDCMVVYGDHDELSARGERSNPHFTPRWSPEYARAWNYVGGAIAFRRGAAAACGATWDVVPDCPDYDLLLRLGATGDRGRVRRIPRVLFHEAAAERDSAALARRLNAERRTLEALMRRQNTAADPQGIVLSVTAPSGVRRIAHPRPAKPPIASVIIPSRDNPVLLRRAVDSVLAASYPASQVVVVDNGSRGREQHALLDTLRNTPHVTVIRDDREFNYSCLNNDGRRAATGDVLVLLNDDVEATDPGWLEEMVSLAVAPGVGCVGALLLYPATATQAATVQHAGVVLGIHGVAGHAFRHAPADRVVADRLLQAQREVSAVTGACLAVRAELYDQLGGLDESLPVTLNDIDFCLRVRGLGYRNLVTPYARLTHHESRSRGQDVTPKSLARLTRETAKFMRRWGDVVLDDPYYSPHRSTSHEDFRMRQLG